MWPNEALQRGLKSSGERNQMCVPVKFDAGTVLTVGGAESTEGWLVERDGILMLHYRAIMAGDEQGSQIFYPQHQVGPKGDLRTSIVWNRSFEVVGEPIHSDALVEVLYGST